MELVSAQADRIGTALENRYDRFLAEDYYIIHVREALDATGQPLRADELIDLHGSAIAQIVRGEAAELASPEQHEVLASRLSLLSPLTCWLSPGAEPSFTTLRRASSPRCASLEYANSQLVQFRHYDDVLTRVLASVYKLMERRGGFWSRWKRAPRGPAAQRPAPGCHRTIRTHRQRHQVPERHVLTRRAYRLASEKVGVNDYRRLVDQKLHTAGELYDSMVNEFHQGRAFVLELVVVIILVIDLIALFTGKSK